MTEILWRPIFTVETEAHADKAVEAIMCGKRYGMFVPNGTPMADDIKKMRKNKPNYRPYIASAAINAGLLSPESFCNPGDITFDTGGTIGFARGKAHFDLIADIGPVMNFHTTRVGREFGILLRPTADFDSYISMAYHPDLSTEKIVTLEKVRSEYHTLVSEEILDGYISEAPIEPIIEASIAEAGDTIVFMEKTPVVAGVGALPTPHWYIPLTFKRESAAFLFMSPVSDEYPTHVTPMLADFATH